MQTQNYQMLSDQKYIFIAEMIFYVLKNHVEWR